ncbi:MAG: hypothetical protein ACOVO0_14705 [Burkholderiaceae bacterium]
MDSSNPFNLPAFSAGGLTPEQRANLEVAIAAGESSGGVVGLTPGEAAALDLADSTQPRSRVAGRGDSWARIARQEYGDERYALALAQANGARSSILRLGAEVQLPDLNGANLRQGGAFIAADAAMRAPTQTLAAGVVNTDPRTVVTTDGITLGDLQTLNAAFARDAASTNFVGPREPVSITGEIRATPYSWKSDSLIGKMTAGFFGDVYGSTIGKLTRDDGLAVNPLTGEILSPRQEQDAKLNGMLLFAPGPKGGTAVGNVSRTGFSFGVNALPETGFTAYQRFATSLDNTLYNLNPLNYEWGLTSGSVARSGVGPLGPRMSGPVEVRVPTWATQAQAAEFRIYADVANQALEAGALSSTGRVSTNGALREMASEAARTERIIAASQGRPYSGVVGHGPDTTWTGNPDAFRWIDQNFRVNSSLGGQSNRYPLGYRPTEFMVIGQ